MIDQNSPATERTQSPSGTVTFLFTDIEGSTKLARQNPDRWERLRARHHAILREAIESQNGYVFQIIGDAFCAAFHTAGEAFQAAIQAQVDLQAENWGDTPIKVRMGIHTGHAEKQEAGDYIGYLCLSRVQRLMSAGHGGQTLLSQTTRDLVCDELPPGISLRDLGECRLKDLARPERVFQLLSPNLPADFPPLRTLETASHNLPVQLTSFIGREKEMGEIQRLLNEKRLVTLTGPGGTGKTRLALQTAADLLEAYPNGIWQVELASLSDPALVPQAVATALGVREQQGRPVQETLTDYLREKNLLLILDNCEHLVEACAGLADALLHGCPGLKILATSREALGIAGEVVFLVLPLTIPDAHHLQSTPTLLEYESVRLFSERAAAASSAFTLTDDNAFSLTQVCQRLDGIPLAIELAAARVKMLSVEQIATRLDDCFRLLTGGSRTALPRHQTLQALIDWSYDLLSESERCLFRRLAVFAGEWTLEAAEAVCCDEEAGLDILELLAQLVNKSLVVVEYEQGKEVRYHMLETVRQYAWEKLVEKDEEEQVRTRHLAYFLQFAEEAEPHIVRADQVEWLARLERNHENLRAALEWCLSGAVSDSTLPPEVSLRLVNALCLFWRRGCYWQEGQEWFERALANAEPSSKTIVRARALIGASLFFAENDWRQAIPLVDESISLCRELNDKPVLADALLTKAIVIDLGGETIEERGTYSSIRTLLDESLNLVRELGDKYEMGGVLFHLGQLALRERDISTAHHFIQECLKLESEDRRQKWAAFLLLGEIAMEQGDLPAARLSCEKSLSYARELGDKEAIANALLSLGYFAMGWGDYPQATELGVESLTIARDLGNKYQFTRSIYFLGCVDRYRGDYKPAVDLLTECLSIARQLKWIAGTTLTIIRLGELARLQGNFTSARTFYAEALAMGRELYEREWLARLLEETAALCSVQGEVKQAATLFGAADDLRTAMHRVLLPVVREAIDRNLSVTREKLGEEIFMTAWAEGQKMTAEETIAYLDAIFASSNTSSENKYPEDDASSSMR